MLRERSAGLLAPGGECIVSDTLVLLSAKHGNGTPQRLARHIGVGFQQGHIRPQNGEEHVLEIGMLPDDLGDCAIEMLQGFHEFQRR